MEQEQARLGRDGLTLISSVLQHEAAAAFKKSFPPGKLWTSPRVFGHLFSGRQW